MKQLLFILFLSIGTPLCAQQIVLNELMSANDTTFLDEDGDFSDWVELYNTTSSPINLENYSLSDGFAELDKWTFPSVVIPSHGFLVVFLSGKNKSYSGSELHTNFKLKSTGEYLILSNDLGVVVDHFLPVDLDNDYSFGRLPDGENTGGFLNQSTPNASNNGVEFISFIDFSHPQGFYPNSFDLEMTCQDTIYYTLDGSLPTNQSLLYDTSVDIVENTANKLSLIPTTPNDFVAPSNGFKQGIVIRAQPYRNGAPSGPVHNRTYFTQEDDYGFEVLSVIIDSSNFFNQDTGIYVPGVHYNSNNPFWSGNYYQRGIDWERDCSVTLFLDGEEEFSENMGVRISGNGSRSYMQKSLRFYMRDEYGKSTLRYPLFPNRKYGEVKRFVARSAFTSLIHFGSSLFKDELIQALAHLKKMDIDLQMARPTVVFINGEYWGIQTIKERQDEHYLHSLYGIDKDSVDIIDGYLTADAGSATDFIDLLDFVEQNDLSIPENYEYVEERIDVPNFIDYYILETFFGNADWPGNNMRLWRPHTPDGKWRFLLYDLDATIGTVHHDPIERLDTLDNNQASLFRNLLLSQSFKNDFVCRYQHHLTTTFHPDLMKAFLHDFRQKYAPELPRHVSRWNYPNTMENWNQSCEYLEYFFEHRPDFMRSFLKDNFNFETMETFGCPMGETAGISIYPNPAENLAYLRLSNSELIDGEVSIYNTQGSLIAKEAVEYMTQHLPVANLQSGLYIVIVQKGNITRTAKLLLK